MDRQAFMRQMGITDDDMKVSVEDSVPAPRASRSDSNSSDRRIKFASHCEYMDRPKPKMNSSDVAAAAPPASQSSSQSRADFLRSLGIDNAESPVDASTSTPHASKEYLKRAVMSSNDAPVQRQEIPAPRPDLTLGQRRSLRTEANPPVQAASTSDDGVTAEELKDQGNQAFESGDFRRAVRLYSKAIERDPTNAALYSNRSAAYLQGSKQMGMDTRTMALRDAEKAIELRPTWFKGHSRKGDALFKLEAFAEAAAAYEQGLQFDEGNINLQQSMQGARRAAAGVPRKDRSAVSLVHEEAERAMDQRTVFDMVDELRESQRKVNANTTTGYDYRARELERFRMSKESVPSSSSTANSSFSQANASTNANNTTTTAPESEGRTRFDRASVPEEFNSNAAAAYQNELLERYRKKKSQQK